MSDGEKLILKKLRVVYIPEWQADDGGYIAFGLSEHYIWVDSFPSDLADQIKTFVEKWERIRDECDL